ncbi:hypothetical protein CGRA01v4_06663 [Colletotrichum graminicola]|uniref:Chloramphenicol phosphotransferase-like protein n=1 Tax=Colletotrichum graminicola (strain M1.001 / M2 / FGSC 10212) TaxID=645133 RepID=E3Q351_COLGM|nr:uncharacterized protein GLRG_00174 [Colletotrichum graminicola M1.001]EFQ25030.1 hypothetical protein GLRG_00174 [Colletotrichum graminicola M1.001]WDK15381.1 hypothetical protein CGRA01v4_06663 [Colletotrichum graminicola]
MPFFIYINGFPGVGKLTVAKDVCKLIQGSRVFHNHLVIDPVAAMLDRGSEGYDELRAEFRRHALHVIATRPELEDTAFIFTDSRESSAQGSTGVKDYQRAAEVRGVPFISIILHCKLDENLRRLEGRNRGNESGRSTKLIDGKILRRVRENEEVFRCGGELELELDITDMKPSEAARVIVHHAYTMASKKREVPSPRRSQDLSVL